ncbi:minovincinine 19-hydroxy-O-acetyltransferase-like [Ziziphus jujuba]|uniref:Minovincinine 19-hydroxy-O-acetyltransferase-like n=1 Tax=Ziziphus jujuba TaxID=326968 RepID=A0ABM3ZWM5_ZIZJJ|nr:minovincinine 19-hydroxy-O-acetyltransferase-like [Ziziphus jujuba]
MPVIKCVSKRFVFDGLSIAALKAKAASESVPQPTRLEVVTDLIWKCAIAAVSARRRPSSTPSNSDDVNAPLMQHVLTQAVNLHRTIIQPPFTEKYSIGNLCVILCCKVDSS